MYTGSFNIQEFKYEELLESLVIICGFTPGSTTDKCKIRISSNHSDYNTTTHNITRANSDSLIAYDIIPQIPAGTYILQVIEEYDNDVIIVEGSVDIPSPSSCIPDKITSVDSILTSKTPSVRKLCINSFVHYVIVIQILQFIRLLSQTNMKTIIKMVIII